jgi:hypothetical protein
MRWLPAAALLAVLAISSATGEAVHRELQAVTVTVASEADLVRALASAGAAGVTVLLPASAIALNAPLALPAVPVVFQGQTGASLSSALQCANATSLLLASTGPLTINRVALRGCSGPGLVLPASGASAVTISDSLFTGFTRSVVRMAPWGSI